MSGHYSQSGYASGTRLQNIDGISFTRDASADAMADLSRENCVGISRLLMRNNPIYKGVIGRCVSYVVGEGFGLQAQADEAWNKQAEKLWADFWRSPCVSGTLTGRKYESLVLTELLTTGDSFQALVSQGGAPFSMQLFESEQCVMRSRNNNNGIVLDDYARPINYLFAPYGRNGYVTRAKITEHPADTVIHLYEPERPSATRGMPALQSSFAMLHRINDICDAEALARQMLSHLALSVTRDDAQASAYTESAADTPDNRFRITELDYATIFHGKPGDDIRGIDRNMPGSDFEKSMLLFLRVLGLPLGMPLELVMLDWTKSNYSQSRAVLQQAYQNFRGWQQMLKNGMSKIYVRKIKEWTASALLPANKAAYAHDWIVPSFPWIDEEKELKAQGHKMELCLTTHAEVCKSLQHDPDVILQQRENEVKGAIERAQRIEEETGVAVPYQYFCGLATSNMNPNDVGETEPDPDVVVDDKDDAETDDSKDTSDE